MKSLFDFTLSLAALPFVLILSAVCCVVIRLESQGNPVFCQTRVGKNKQPFTLYKLRTMKQDTGDHASHEVSTMQITKIGGFLRKTKLDELPQILNVLFAQMSFVGPRPGLPNQIELTEAREKHGVYVVRPGITGPSQLSGIDMSTPVELAISDSNYIKNQSFSTDILYIWQTALGRGGGDAAKK